MITFHHAWLKSWKARGLQIFVSLKQLSSTCHVSYLAALDTDHQHKFSLTYLFNFTVILFYTLKPVVPRSIYTLRRFTAELRCFGSPSLPQVMSQKGSSSTGILGLNIKIKHATELWEMTIKDMDEFGKIGVKSLSYNQSLIHSAYASTESIADSDLEDEQFRKMLASPRNPICDLFTVGEVVLWSLFRVVPSRFRRLSCGGVVLTSLALDEFSEWSAMVSKLRRGVLGSQERSELKEYWQMQSRLMGEGSGRANSVQNRMCWTRWRCRRCCSNIPAGLQGKYRQAVAAKSGEGSTGSSTSSGEEDRKTRSLEAENKELRARSDAMEKKERVQGGSRVSLLKEEEEETRKMCGEISWKSKMRPSVARNWMNRSKRCRRSYERSTDCRMFPRICRRASRSHCSTSCKRWRKGGTISCLRTRRCKRGKRYKASRTEEENLQKDSIAAEEEMRKLQEEVRQKEERHLFLSNKIDKNKMQDAEMVAELQNLQAAGRRGSNASQTGDDCLEASWQQLITLGANGIEVFAQKLHREMGAAQRQMPRREGGRRNSENEQEQGKANQKLVLPTPGGINQGAPASSLELDLPRVLSVPGEGGSAGKSGTQGDRKRGPSRSPGRHSMDMRKRMTMWEEWCLNQKRKKNNQGKDPKTLEENSQGRDPSTLERNSQAQETGKLQ